MVEKIWNVSYMKIEVSLVQFKFSLVLLAGGVTVTFCHPTRFRSEPPSRNSIYTTGHYINMGNNKADNNINSTCVALSRKAIFSKSSQIIMNHLTNPISRVFFDICYMIVIKREISLKNSNNHPNIQKKCSFV